MKREEPEPEYEMTHNYEKAMQDLQQGVASNSYEQDMEELDVTKFLDRIYNELLGNVISEEGTWVKDPKRKACMNELGATEFIQEISARVSVHQQLSELEEMDILNIASRGAEIYADKIEDNYEKWDIEPRESNFESIAQRLCDVLFIAMRIAKKGGMKKYRERKRNPYLSIPKPVTPEGML